MIKQSIQREQLKYILKHPQLERDLADKAKTVRKQIIDNANGVGSIENDIMEALQMSVHLKPTQVSNSSKHKDLYDVLEKTAKMTRNYSLDLLNLYLELQEQIQQIRRVNLILSTLLPDDYKVIKLLYIDNDKWDYVETILNINHRSLVILVNSIFEDIIYAYNSSMSNTELIRQGIGIKKLEEANEAYKKRLESQEDEQTKQLSIEDIAI